MARGEKTERPRANYNGATRDGLEKGELVTVLDKGKLKSTIRSSRGFVIEDVKNKELDFKHVDEQSATLKFEAPTG